MTQAILRAANFKQTDEYCRLVARKGGGLVLVQVTDARGKSKGHPFSADRMRLRQLTDRTAPIADGVIDALPWQGRGEDPSKVDRSGPAAERAFFS